MKTCLVQFLGMVDYSTAQELQIQACEARKREIQEDILFLLEHPPTITLGRNGHWSNLLVSDRDLAARRISAYEVDRGGDITYHGPGQLVGYPILRLDGRERDVHNYMRNLEEVLLRVLSAYGIDAERREGFTGVWTAQGKIAALGVHISRWVTRHGFALNVGPDLSLFDLIVPCGISGGSVASMSSILCRPVGLRDVAERVAFEFGEVMRRAMNWTRVDDTLKGLANIAHEVA